MTDRMISVEGDLEKIAQNLTALIEIYAEEPHLAPYVEGLRAAREKALLGVELLRRKRGREDLAGTPG